MLDTLGFLCGVNWVVGDLVCPIQGNATRGECSKVHSCCVCTGHLRMGLVRTDRSSCSVLTAHFALRRISELPL